MDAENVDCTKPRKIWVMSAVKEDRDAVVVLWAC